MKKGIIVVNRYCKIPSMINQANRILEEFKKLNVDVKIVKNGYNFYLDDNSNINFLDEIPDFCVYLDKDKYLGEALEKLGVKVFNPITSISNCDDKMLTYLKLSKSNIKMPKTISSPLCYSNVDIPFSESQKIIDNLSLPVVVKLSFSSLGKGVFKADSLEELNLLMNKYKFDAKIYQSFISTSFGKDVRVIVIGGKFVCAFLRSSNGKDFRSNAALGGNGEKFQAPKSFISLAEKVSRILNLDYMGIDLMFGENNEPIVCEVNSNAFFEVAEEITQINVAKTYVEYILKVIN